MSGIDWIILSVVGPLIVLTLAAAAARLNWICELATHFRVQYAGLLFISAAGLLLRNHPAAAAVSAAVGAVNLLAVLPAYGRVALPGAQASSRRLRILVMNVNFRSRAFQRALRAIERVKPDIVCVIEVNRAWKEQLEALRTRYPYVQGVAYRNGWGLLLMSRLPLTDSQFFPGKIHGIPYVLAQLAVEGKPIDVILAHTYAPVMREYAALRNAQMACLAAVAAKRRQPVIVAGDFNCSPWSPYFKRLLYQAQLKDTRQGFGLQPSWPAWNPLLGIPIDHCLVSADWRVERRSAGPDIGSDHYPVTVDLALP